jgi:hypothetical protein
MGRNLYYTLRLVILAGFFVLAVLRYLRYV